MNSFENFIVPERKNEWDVFKEIVVFVGINFILVSLVFFVVYYVTGFLIVELYPYFLFFAGVFAVYRVIATNRIISDNQVSELIQRYCDFPKLRENIMLVVEQNTFIRVSDLNEINSLMLEELQCMKVMHQTANTVKQSASRDGAFIDTNLKIQAYVLAVENLKKYITQI